MTQCETPSDKKEDTVKEVEIVWPRHNSKQSFHYPFLQCTTLGKRDERNNGLKTSLSEVEDLRDSHIGIQPRHIEETSQVFRRMKMLMTFSFFLQSQKRLQLFSWSVLFINLLFFFSTLRDILKINSCKCFLLIF